MPFPYKPCLAALTLATLLACGDDAQWGQPVKSIVTPPWPNHDVPHVGRHYDKLRVWDTSGRTTRLRPPLPSARCDVFFQAVDNTWDALLERSEVDAFNTCLHTAGVHDLRREAVRHGCTMDPQRGEAEECAPLRRRQAAALDTCQEPMNALAALPHWHRIAAVIDSAAEHRCYDLQHGNVPMPH